MQTAPQIYAYTYLRGAFFYSKQQNIFPFTVISVPVLFFITYLEYEKLKII